MSRCALEEAKGARARCQELCLGCRAWWPEEKLFDLASVAPRLALARDQRRVELRVREVEEVRLTEKRLKADRLVAHRELQALRAGALPPKRSKGKYVGWRYKKLEKAQRERRSLG